MSYSDTILSFYTEVTLSSIEIGQPRLKKNDRKGCEPQLAVLTCWIIFLAKSMDWC